MGSCLTTCREALKEALKRAADELSGYLDAQAQLSNEPIRNVRQRSLAVLYYTGHGQNAGLVASNGEVVPFAFFEGLLLFSGGALWNVFLVDACRDRSTSTTPRFELEITPTSAGRGLYALGNACAAGYTAQDGVYTSCLHKVSCVPAPQSLHVSGSMTVRAP
jgi:hypothetical protein